jgi:hypothetical protein
MAWCPINDLKTYIKTLTQDDSGRQSLSKTILFWSFITSSLFCWKLVVMGGFTEAYFAIYLTIASGHTLTSKFLDKKIINNDDKETP